MKLFRGLRNLRPHEQGCVVTLGTYDGLHIGHQALIHRLQRHGQRLERRTLLLTFEPMPREFFAPESAPARLTNLRERWRILERIGLDGLAVLRFDEQLRSMSGEAFATWLAQELKTPLVVVGHDFKFGRGGEADAQMLAQAGRRLGFEVEVAEPVLVRGCRASSTGIREALAHGNLAQAREWLGRPYSMVGRVVRGERLGRDLGFPTANLRLQRLRSPVKGIFAVRVYGVAAGSLPGVASLGTRPTVGGTLPLLETHVFDFAGDLYGREIEVEFVAKLRDERHFATLDSLIEQMHLDAEQARGILTDTHG